MKEAGNTNYSPPSAEAIAKALIDGKNNEDTPKMSQEVVERAVASAMKELNAK